jgi:hypothetical protein
MRRTTTIFIILSTFIIGILWYGLTIPAQYKTSCNQHFDITPTDLWITLVDFEKYAEWRENVYAVERLPGNDGYGAWKEIDAEGNTAPFQIVKHEPELLLIIKTIKKLDPRNETWTFKLSPDEDNKGVTLSIVEQGEIIDLLPRVITHFFIGHEVDTDAYLRSISNKFAQRANNQN